MTDRLSVALMFGALASLSAAAVHGWRHALPTASEPPFVIASLPGAPGNVSDSVLAECETMIASNDPFRLSNTPASTRYDPSIETLPGVSTSGIAPLRPQFTLKAIVGGPPWQAIVDGIPGQPPGTIVRSGLTFEKLTVRSVTRDSIIIQGPDTTWVLSFPRRS